MVMRLATLAAVLTVLSGLVADAAPISAKATQYSIQTPDIGGCRLKGIASDSDNFKFYASVSSKDVSVNDGCARCIKVSKDGVAASLTAYVLDVCQGCQAGSIKLSAAALSALSIDPNANNGTVSYKFSSCPAAFQSGTSVRACLMEGASNSYIPLQFFNSQKVIASVNISGVAAKQQKDSFFFSGNPNVANSKDTQWFKDVQVTLTSTDGETQSGSFVFGGTSGCAMSTFQFSAASTADGDDGAASGGSGGDGASNTGVIIGAVAGGIAALIVIIGSVFFIRRRRAAKEFDHHDEPDQQYLSPTTKARPRSPERPTYAADNSMHNSTDDPSDHDGPESPTMNFDEAATPPAAIAAGRNPYGARRVEEDYQPRAMSPPQPIQQQHQQPPPPVAVPAPRVVQQAPVVPQTYSYSKPVAAKPLTSNTSFRSNGSGRAVPTFQAPVVNRFQDSDGEESGRSSFDIDDLRETEEIKERERFSSMSNELKSAVAPHSSESAYATGHVTSPQSYVRATSLRRNSTKVPERPTLRFTSTAPASQQDRYNSDSLDSSTYSDRDSYASDNVARTDSTADASVNPNTGSFRDSSSGYSRESLGILGYPYAKKPSTRGSLTEAQL